MSNDSPSVESYRVGENETAIENHERRISWLERVAWMGMGGMATVSLVLGAWGFVEFVLTGL